MESSQKKKIWRGLIEHYNPSYELPFCFGDSKSEDYRRFQSIDHYNQYFVDELAKVHPKIKAFAEKMFKEYKETVKRYEEHAKRKKEMAEEREHLYDSMKPEIELSGKDILVSKFAADFVEVLKNKNTLFFRPASKDIVEVSMIKIKNKDNEVKNDDNTYTGFSKVSSNRFVTLAEQYIVPGYYSQDRETKEMIFHNKSMSPQQANLLMECEILHTDLPHINRIFTHPLPIILNGDITFPCKGYDSRFGSWTTPDAPHISNPEMTLEKAKDIINDVFGDFCFKTDQDKSNAIAALLTPFLRGLFPRFCTRTPVFFYLGNRERIGKDYLAGITGIIYEGVPLEEAPISNSEARGGSDSNELRKKIFSAMISGRKRMHFSNNKGYINNAVFESIITAQKYSDRVLGRSEMLVFDNELDFSLSGNSDIGYTPDFANRCRFIRMFLDIEDANSKKYKNDALHTWVLSNRDVILSALYSMVRHWIDSGKPPGSLPFASFPEWAKICGGVMESAGYLNPCTPDINLFGVGGDSETEDMKELFRLGHKSYKNEYITRKQIIEIVKSDKVDIFPDFNLNIKSDQIKFGIILSKFCDRILGTVRLSVKDKSVRPARQELMFSDDLNSKLTDFDPPKEDKKPEKEPKSNLGKDGRDGRDNPESELLQENNNNNNRGKKTMPNLANPTKNLDEKKYEFSPEILQELEQKLEDIPEENIEDLVFELKDSALLKLPDRKDPEKDPKIKEKVVIAAKPAPPKTNLNYNDFIDHMLPDTIRALQLSDNTKEPPLIEDIIGALTTGGFYTRQQIEIWIEMSLKQGSTYEPRAGRLQVL